MPEPTSTSAAAAPNPTDRQLAFLKDLAAQRGHSFAYPATAAEASREIHRLHSLRRTAQADIARERSQIADDMATRRGDGARVRDAEITGYGSSARWAGGSTMTGRAGDPADFPGAFAYEHTDVPAGVTLTTWRRSRAAQPRRRRSLRALLRRLRGRSRPSPEVAR